MADIDVTQILSQREQGNPAAADQLLPLVYDELRRLAAQKLSQENPGQTLQATALVHEAYLRLVDQTTPQEWDNRRQFFAAAAEAMCRILIDSARRKQAAKRGGEHHRVELAEGDLVVNAAPDHILALDEAFTRFGQQDSQAAELSDLERAEAGCRWRR